MELRKTTIGQLLKERVRLTPDAACIGDSHKSCSWKETADSAEKLALLYMQLGLKKGDHAAVWGVNSTDYVSGTGKAWSDQCSCEYFPYNQ